MKGRSVFSFQGTVSTVGVLSVGGQDARTSVVKVRHSESCAFEGVDRVVDAFHAGVGERAVAGSADVFFPISQQLQAGIELGALIAMVTIPGKVRLVFLRRRARDRAWPVPASQPAQPRWRRTFTFRLMSGRKGGIMKKTWIRQAD